MTDTLKTWNTPELVALNSDLGDVLQGPASSLDGNFLSETSGA